MREAREGGGMVSLRLATAADAPLLRRWDEQPHVVAADPHDDWGWETELGRGEAGREQFLIELGDQPIGYLEILDPARDEEHYWGADVPAGLRAIDLWIGEAAHLGKGHGTQAMRLALARCFADAAVLAVLVDPLASNVRAQRFYERLGFRLTGQRRFGEDQCCVWQLARSDWSLPASIATPADLAVLQAAAQPQHTPCGARRMVWHGWGEGAPVVLLHGGSGSWTHWARNVAALVAAGRRVLVPDLPGFGDSDALPHGSDADALPPWVEAGLQEMLGKQPVDVVGFSFGGLVAGLLAVQHPARVQRLVLVGAPALSAQPTGGVVLRPWNGEPPGPRRDAIHRDNLLRLMLADAASVDELALRIHDANLARDRMKQRRLHRTDLLARTLPAVRCAVAGLWGEQDALYRGRTAVVEQALARAPRFGLLELIPCAGHWVQYEDAPAFNMALQVALALPCGG